MKGVKLPDGQAGRGGLSVAVARGASKAAAATKSAFIVTEWGNKERLGL